MKTKVCSMCGLDKTLDLFPKHKGQKQGVYSMCKDCKNSRRRTDEYRATERVRHKKWRSNPVNNEKQKQWSKKFRQSEKGKKAIKDDMLKRSYGINLEQYESLLKKQNGKCAICNRTHIEDKKLVVDHCHKTGEIRGLLCSQCNTGLGLFGDNIENLNNAISYLNKERKD